MRRISKFFQLISSPDSKAEPEFIEIASHSMPIVYRRHGRARNYVLRLRCDRTVLVTVPRYGNKKFAKEFVISRVNWLEKQWRIMETKQIPPQVLKPGMEVLLHGRPVILEVERQEESWSIRIGSARGRIDSPDGNLRPAVEALLREIAVDFLVPHGEQLAKRHGASIRKIVIRNQRSRWGSCSFNGTISLNWRLIQLPDYVRDYIIVHELMHMRELNHSARFWGHVERICPNYRQAEAWLKHHSTKVGF